MYGGTSRATSRATSRLNRSVAGDSNEDYFRHRTINKARLNQGRGAKFTEDSFYFIMLKNR